MVSQGNNRVGRWLRGLFMSKSSKTGLLRGLKEAPE